MEALLNSFERRYPKFGIPGIMRYVVGASAVAYVFCLVHEPLQRMLLFDRASIVQGQVWRLLTWQICPAHVSARPLSILFLCFYYYLVFFMGDTLEREWGTVRINIYYLTCLLCTTLFGFLSPVPMHGLYLKACILLAFATLFPDFSLLIFFVIPLKMKYLAILAVLGTLYNCVQLAAHGAPLAALPLAMPTVIYMVFFYERLRSNARTTLPKRLKNIAEPAQARKKKDPFHTCHTCGKTELDDPRMEFRVCTDCAGGVEYCREHLPGHQHVLEAPKAAPPELPEQTTSTYA